MRWQVEACSGVPRRCQQCGAVCSSLCPPTLPLLSLRHDRPISLHCFRVAFMGGESGNRSQPPRLANRNQMDSTNPFFIDSRVASAVVVVLFCAATALLEYSGNQIWGNCRQSRTERCRRSKRFRHGRLPIVAFVLFPWCGVLGYLGEGWDIVGDALASSISAALLFSLLRLLTRHFPRAARGILALLLFCAVVDTYSFAKDMQLLRIIEKNDGPGLHP